MQQQTLHMGIVFADVCGSTRLFDKLGDVAARQLISRALNTLANITERYRGRVIKTIGDEIMSTFPDADSAVQACMDMQEAVSAGDNCDDQTLIRVGVHFGSALIQPDGDIYGDSVNIAARMAGIAKANQIITTEETVEALGAALRDHTREFDRTTVKGRTGVLNIYQVVWRREDMTRLAFVSHAPEVTKGEEVRLILYWGDEHVELTQDGEGVAFGRGEQADYQVNSHLASRIHLKIEPRRGKFVITDQSTNGTYLKDDYGRDLFLRREEAPLIGAGMIGLGCPPDKVGSGEQAIRYEVKG